MSAIRAVKGVRPRRSRGVVELDIEQIVPHRLHMGMVYKDLSNPPRKLFFWDDVTSPCLEFKESFADIEKHAAGTFLYVLFSFTSSVVSFKVLYSNSSCFLPYSMESSNSPFQNESRKILHSLQMTTQYTRDGNSYASELLMYRYTLHFPPIGQSSCYLRGPYSVPPGLHLSLTISKEAKRSRQRKRPSANLFWGVVGVRVRALESSK